MDYIKYIPNEMKEITEYKELDKVGNATIIVVKSDMEQVSDNHYMSSLDEYGCTRLEKIMNITYEELPALETRRLNIITKANNTLPYTIYNLKRKIASLLGNDGFDVSLEYGKYHLTIILFVQNFDKIEYLKEHIEGMIPCNIILDLMVIYNQYKLFKKWTYNNLKSMTHKYMRQHYFEEEDN